MNNLFSFNIIGHIPLQKAKTTTNNYFVFFVASGALNLKIKAVKIKNVKTSSFAPLFRNLVPANSFDLRAIKVTYMGRP